MRACVSAGASQLSDETIKRSGCASACVRSCVEYFTRLHMRHGRDYMSVQLEFTASSVKRLPAGTLKTCFLYKKFCCFIPRLCTEWLVQCCTTLITDTTLC